MVLGHQSLLSNMSGGSNLQPALQLALAAQLASPPRNRAWPPFFPMFAPFLTRPHFPPQHNLLSINNNAMNNSNSSNMSQQRNLQSPPSEDSNDERSE